MTWDRGSLHPTDLPETENQRLNLPYVKTSSEELPGAMFWLRKRGGASGPHFGGSGPMVALTPLVMFSLPQVRVRPPVRPNYEPSVRTENATSLVRFSLPQVHVTRAENITPLVKFSLLQVMSARPSARPSVRIMNRPSVPKTLLP